MRMTGVLFFFQVILVFQNFINPSYTASSDGGKGQKSKKQRSRWTPEMQNAFIEICRSIPPNEPYYFHRLRDKWHELHPNYNVSDSTLLRKLYKIPKNITGRAKRGRPSLKWDDEKTDELIDLYLNSRPYNKSHPIALSEEWERRHPDFPKLRSSQLTSRAREYLAKRSQHVEEESSQRLFEWTDKQDSDLYHIHHVTLPEGQKQPIHMHRIWTDLHPNYRELTYNQLTERVKYLQKNPPDEFFPWTEGQNKELLDIYNSTSPEVADQGHRIHDIWSKIHPRYKFMTPYYLQVHARRLVNNKDLGINRKMCVKFTKEQEKNLADMHQRLTKPNKSLYDFHKAWVRKYPALAHITAQNLRKRAKRLFIRDSLSNADATKGASRPGNTQFNCRKYHKYTPEEKIQLLATYRQTYPRELGHSKRIRDEWVRKNNNATGVRGTSLRKLIQKWIKEDSDRKGKAPMVIPKGEAKSESSPNTSDSSK